jgi:DNA polymerase I-like protein with 3'-5' exonuclease and polymerase domains
MAHGDESGLFWEDPPKRTRARARAVVSAPAQPPECNWKPPTNLPDLRGRKTLSIDCETHDPDLKEKGPGVRRDGYIVGVAIAGEDLPGRYYPVAHGGGGNLDKDLVFDWLRDELTGYDGEVVGAHLLYDLDYLAEQDIHFGKAKFHDVQVAEPLLDENRLSYSLETLAQERLGIGKDEEMLRRACDAYGIRDVKSGLWQLPAKFVGAYAEGDVNVPLDLLRVQTQELEREGLLDLFDLESRLIPMLLAMRRRGVRVLEGKIEEVRARMAQTRQAAFDVLGTDDVWSAASLAMMFDDAGIEYPRTPKTGKPSFTRPWLEAQTDSLSPAVMEARRWDTAINTFVDGHLSAAIDGRIHCQFNQLKSDDGGTVSGRFSSSNPNLQNIPSRDPEITPLMRGLFVPEEGEDWLRFDYSQVEYRLLAHYSRGPGAADARQKFNDDPDTDFHAMCGEMAGKPGPENRKRVKNINFGKVYGSGAATMAKTMGGSLEEAMAFIELYDRELPWVKKTLDAASDAAAKNGVIVTLLGRKARFDLWEPKAWGAKGVLRYEEACEKWGEKKIKRFRTYKALNSLLQGGAADVLKKAMADIWDAGICDVLGAPLLTVHDELDWSKAHTAEAEEAAKEVKYMMEHAVDLRVPLIADREDGPNWGELK